MFHLLVKLKKELAELYQKIENQILESDFFNVLKERYQSLTLLNQKLIKLFFIALFLAGVLYLPFYYLSSSTIAWFNLKEKHRLSIELLKAREKSSLSTMRDTETTLKNKIQEVTQKYFSESSTVTKESKKTLKSNSSIELIIFKVKVPYLNIRQAIQLGTELEAFSQVRLDELSFEESENYKSHYDMTYQLSAFIIKRDSKLKRESRKRQRIKKEEPIKKENKLSKSKIKKTKEKKQKDKMTVIGIE